MDGRGRRRSADGEEEIEEETFAARRRARASATGGGRREGERGWQPRTPTHPRRGPVLGLYVLTSFHSVYESPLRFTTDHRGPFSLRDSTDAPCAQAPVTGLAGARREKRGNGGNERIIFGPGRKNRDDWDRRRETLRALSASGSRRSLIRILASNGPEVYPPWKMGVRRWGIQRLIGSIGKFGWISLNGRNATTLRYGVALVSLKTIETPNPSCWYLSSQTYTNCHSSNVNFLVRSRTKLL